MDMKRYRAPLGIISAMLAALASVALLALAGLACRGTAARSEPSPPPAGVPAARPESKPSAPATSAGAPERRPAAAGDERPAILFVGTSLTAGLGLDPSEAYPALVQQKLDAAGLGYRVVNAGVSGETSAGALRRAGWLLRQKVAVVVLETGANDGLRGQDPEATRANIQAFFDEVKRRAPDARLVLAQMEALPNYGEDYRRRFRAVYPEVARASGATLLPFLLDGVAGVPALNQPDGIHPTAEGHERVAENVWKALRPVL